MRSFHLFSVVAMALSFGAVSLGANTASAAPCCSSPMCTQDEPPSICDRCNDCADEEAAPVEESGYDEVEAICYMPAMPTPDAGEADEADETVQG